MTPFYYILFVFFGISLIPSNALACDKSVMIIENSCSKQMDWQTDGVVCCLADHSKGMCEHPFCQCPTYSFHNFQLAVFSHSYTPLFFFKRPNTYYHETYWSSGFYSIWTPPHIG